MISKQSTACQLGCNCQLVVRLVFGHQWLGIEGAAFACDSDVARMDGVLRNSTRMRALMRAYARHVSTQTSQTTIAADLAVNDGAMAPNTVSDYLDALSRAYVVEDLPAWNPALRSKTAIRTSPTRHFVDPSIGALDAVVGDDEVAACLEDLHAAMLNKPWFEAKLSELDLSKGDNLLIQRLVSDGLSAWADGADDGRD